MATIMPGKWLTEGFDRYIANEPELLQYWDSPGYSGGMTGEGTWLVLYVEDAPVGLLWYSPGTQGCDLEAVAGGLNDLLVLEQLRIRFLAESGVEPNTAYATIAERYTTSDEDWGMLSAAKPLVVSGVS